MELPSARPGERLSKLSGMPITELALHAPFTSNGLPSILTCSWLESINLMMLTDVILRSGSFGKHWVRITTGAETLYVRI
jgi:hypothetical protein